MPDRPIPLLGDLSLESVQRIEHSMDSGFASMPIAGLPGELQPRASRLSHRIALEGVLFGAAAAGDELTFSADITKALDLQKVVITRFEAVEMAGNPARFSYRVLLAESPPLPPPAQVSGFGGLDDFGLGDLGFDTDILGDIADIAGDIAGAVTDALEVLDALSALTNLDGLALGNAMAPISDAADRVSSIGTDLQNAFGSLSDLLS